MPWRKDLRRQGGSQPRRARPLVRLEARRPARSADGAARRRDAADAQRRPVAARPALTAVVGAASAASPARACGATPRPRVEVDLPTRTHNAPALPGEALAVPPHQDRTRGA